MPMPTPWGELEVLDAHAHLFSRSFFAALAGQKGVEDVEGMVRSLGWDVPPASNSEMASLWVRELDRHGVSKCVLIASVPGDEESAAVALASHPNRFFGYFMLDPLAEFALARARRAFDELGLHGLCLFPAMHRFSVQDERLQPFYELAAERSGRVVFVHSGVLTVGVRAKLGLPSRFDMSRSNPIDLHRVALEHPATNFVVPHFGAGYLRETLMLASLASNVHVDTSSSNGWTKYLTPRPSLADVLDQFLDVIGPERLLFGSDSSFFPRGWRKDIFDSQCEALHSLGCPAADASAILGGNLSRLLAR